MSMPMVDGFAAVIPDGTVVALFASKERADANFPAWESVCPGVALVAHSFPAWVTRYQT